MSDWFVDSLDPAVEALGISKAFTGLVIVGIAGNAVENVVGITLAAKGQADLAISVVKNSVAQIAVFLYPALVLLSLFFDEQLTFVLNPVYIGALVIMALAVWQVTGDGKAVRSRGWRWSRSTSSWRCWCSSNELELVARQLSPRAGREPVDSQPRVDAPVQPPDAVADRLAHPPHLTVAALVQDELEAGRAEPADAGGRRHPVLELDPFGERAERLVVRLLPGLDLVDLLDAVARDARAGARAGRRS